MRLNSKKALSFLQVKAFLCLAFSCILNNTFAQFKAQQFVSYGEIYNSGNVRVELLINLSTTPCAQQNSQSRFKLKMTGVNSAYASGGYYLNWNMRIVQCNGDILLKNVGISLAVHNIEGENDAMDWEFPGQSVEMPIVANISRNQNLDKDQLIQNVKSIAPKSIIGDSILITGQPTTLRISGGLLGTNAKWVWRESSCDGASIGQGPSITVTPTSNKVTYYVRAESPTDTSACTTKEIEIDDYSKLTKDSKIIGREKICNDNQVQQINLEVRGGRKGYKAEWHWYKDSCGGIRNLIGKGPNLRDSIKKTTTYYVRLEGTTGVTSCLSHTVIVTGSSISAKVINGPDQICEGDSVLLSISGGQLADDPTANWYWYSSRDLINKIGTGPTIKIFPSVINSIYFVRAEGSCNKTDTVSKQIIVKKITAKPSFISDVQIKSEKGKLGKDFTLTIQGGSLGDGARWEWYRKNKSNGELLQTGQERFYSYSASRGKNLIYVIGKGECNNTDPVDVTVDYRKRNTLGTQFGFLNIGTLNPDMSNLVITVGMKSFYLKLKTGLQKNSNGSKVVSSYTCTESGLTNFPINTTSFYEFTGDQYPQRSSYTAGFMIGLQKKNKTHKAIKPFAPTARIYIGGGFGSMSPLWGVNIIQYGSGATEKKWALNTDFERKGPEAELGLFFRFGPINLMGGANLILGQGSKTFIDASVGIGISIY